MFMTSGSSFSGLRFEILWFLEAGLKAPDAGSYDFRFLKRGFMANLDALEQKSSHSLRTKNPHFFPSHLQAYVVA